MADVFLSYSSKDKAEATLIAQALERAGHSVWWDEQLQVGRTFTDDIARELTAAKAVIVVWSEHSIKSDWVRDEANLAREAGKLIPVRIAAVKPPPPFGQFESADLIGWNGSAGNAEWSRVLDSVSDILRGKLAGARDRSLVAPSMQILSSSAGSIALEDVVAVTSKPGWAGMAELASRFAAGIGWFVFLLIPAALIFDALFLGFLIQGVTLYETVNRSWAGDNWMGAASALSASAFWCASILGIGYWLVRMVIGQARVQFLSGGLMAVVVTFGIWSIGKDTMALRQMEYLAEYASEEDEERVRAEAQAQTGVRNAYFFSLEKPTAAEVRKAAGHTRDFIERNRNSNAGVLLMFCGLALFVWLLRWMYQASQVCDIHITTRRGVVKWNGLPADEANAVVGAFSARRAL